MLVSYNSQDVVSMSVYVSVYPVLSVCMPKQAFVPLIVYLFVGEDFISVSVYVCAYVSVYN